MDHSFFREIFLTCSSTANGGGVIQLETWMSPESYGLRMWPSSPTWFFGGGPPPERYGGIHFVVNRTRQKKSKISGNSPDFSFMWL